VVARVHHDSLGAHARARHHRALTWEAAAALYGSEGDGGGLWVHHDTPGPLVRAGHPSRRYPCPYVLTEDPGPTSGEERTRRWGQIPALHWVDGLRPLRKGRKDLSSLRGIPEGPILHPCRERQAVQILVLFEPVLRLWWFGFRLFPPASRGHSFDWRDRAHRS
jgi:hypothetical protein